MTKCQAIQKSKVAAVAAAAARYTQRRAVMKATEYAARGTCWFKTRLNNKTEMLIPNE